VAAIERASVCTFDCPDTCSLNVTVDAGQIIKVRGSESAPFTAGVICNKVAQDMATFVHGRKAPDNSSASPGTRRWTRFMRVSAR
jgi:anaerobic selenocysteine-containing dehydrogenase